MGTAIDISILFDKPDPTQNAALFIEPLAPLSLVTAMPGAYYRSQKEPSEFMIYGMIENLLGWHFSKKERDKIINAIKTHYSKNYKPDKDLKKIGFKDTGVGFKPLLQHHLKIGKLLLKPSIKSFEDYWTQHLKDVDERHAKGTRNYDYTIDQPVNDIYVLPKNERDKKWKKLYEENTGLFPGYYQSPTKREYINVIGKYGYPIVATEKVLKALIDSINRLDNPIYLGANEGWVNINIEML